MSFFEERFKNHEVHEALKKCLQETEEYGLEDLNEEEEIAIDRCRRVLEYAKALIENCDAKLLQFDILDALSQCFNSFSKSWGGFAKDHKWENLTSECDSILSQTALLNANQRFITTSDAKQLRSIQMKIDCWNNEFNISYDMNNKDVMKISDKLNECEKRVDSEISRLSSLHEQQSNAFEKEKEDWEARFKKQLSDTLDALRA